MKRGDVFQECLNRLFKAVGFKGVNQKFIKKHRDWYTHRSWSVESEDEFRKWMVEYVRKELRLTKQVATYETNCFLLNYGWTNLPIKKSKKL